MSEIDGSVPPTRTSASERGEGPRWVVREALPREHRPLGDVVAAAYESLGGPLDSGYANQLRAVAQRATGAVVFAAFGKGEGDEGEEDGALVVGCTTYVPGPDSPWAERLSEGEAGMRMLGVRPDWMGRGVGTALTEACIERARAEGRRALVLHSTPWMAAAHRLYEGLGFVRAPDIDWHPVPDVPLLGYRRDLGGGR